MKRSSPQHAQRQRLIGHQQQQQGLGHGAASTDTPLPPPAPLQNFDCLTRVPPLAQIAYQERHWAVAYAQHFGVALTGAPAGRLAGRGFLLSCCKS